MEGLNILKNSKNDEFKDLIISCEKFQKKAMKNPTDKLIETPTIEFKNIPIIIEVTNIMALTNPVKNRSLT